MAAIAWSSAEDEFSFDPGVLAAGEAAEFSGVTTVIVNTQFNHQIVGNQIKSTTMTGDSWCYTGQTR